MRSFGQSMRNEKLFLDTEKRTNKGEIKSPLPFYLALSIIYCLEAEHLGQVEHPSGGNVPIYVSFSLVILLSKYIFTIHSALPFLLFLSSFRCCCRKAAPLAIEHNYRQNQQAIL